MVHLLFVFKKRKSYAYLQLFRMNLDGDILKIPRRDAEKGKVLMKVGRDVIHSISGQKGGVGHMQAEGSSSTVTAR